MASKGKAVVNEVKKSYDEDGYIGIIEVTTTKPMTALRFGKENIVVLKCDSVSLDKCQKADNMYYYKGSVL